MNPLAALIGLVFLAMGLLAYTGRWKGWIRFRRGFTSTIGFAWLWFGAAATTASLAAAVSSLRPLFFLLVVISAALLVITVVALFWLPRALLPSWYLELRDGSGRRPR
ncbi:MULTISPECIES: hypothetical protein [Microbacterium]|uniref:hypothetical protein n=1 Tax=Microbacterium TaxID=33882 RepID=UPI001D176B28|nr:hypothetical protein [Microbacterium testaceum]MCC4248932.1 hypothetical protein [Microbacterium testaceum]